MVPYIFLSRMFQFNKNANFRMGYLSFDFELDALKFYFSKTQIVNFAVQVHGPSTDKDAHMPHDPNFFSNVSVLLLSRDSQT